MLSKRNLAMMVTMIVVVLVLFLSSVVLKEYFNDYDVNHAAETEKDRSRIRMKPEKNNRSFLSGRRTMVTTMQ